jgi:hypothetical protein
MSLLPEKAGPRHLIMTEPGVKRRTKDLTVGGLKTTLVPDFSLIN